MLRTSGIAAGLWVVALSAAACGGGGGTSLDCTGLFQYAAACSTSDCEADCRARAGATANAQADAIVNCDTAQNCQGDADCLRLKCSAEVTACFGAPDGGVGGGGGTGGGSGAFPSRFVGTLSDLTDSPGTIGRLESTGQATFVRDDNADPRGQSGMFAFYKLETITYTATASGTVGTCTLSANETVTFTNPPAFENLVAIRVQPNGGAYEYDVSVTLTKPFPNGLTMTCNPGGTSTTQFNAEINTTAWSPSPTTTNPSSLVGSASGGPGRTWSWNLQGQ